MRIEPIDKHTNPYLIALFTAIITGIFAIIGFYFTINLQTASIIKQKQFEYRASAYNSFLTTVNRNKSPLISDILSIGQLTKHVATDMEMQILENKFGKLASSNREYNISLQLDSDFNILRMHGSNIVRQYCDDIITILALRESDVNWSKYSEEINEKRDIWIGPKQETEVDYVDTKVTDEERMIFVLLSTLYTELINQLSTELQGNI